MCTNTLSVREWVSHILLLCEVRAEAKERLSIDHMLQQRGGIPPSPYTSSWRVEEQLFSWHVSLSVRYELTFNPYPANVEN